ncbi:MAG TPA: cyclic nucleotide-binding domain-containing protein [Chloroflexi bacterium]|nr:cyclic nucleotide-binding domain-containing protein [Chloroflexota bacterium]
MKGWLRRLLNVRSEEGRCTALLYLLFFLLILGSVWGETTAEALFLAQIGTDAYSFRFLTEAVVTLAFTLVYTAFVDRIDNTRLLIAICGIAALSLLLTRLLLTYHLTIAYYLFYLIGCTVRVILAVHSWTYVSDFYDTRAARRIFPLIGSSGRIAGLVGGAVLRFVVIPIVHAENVPYIWIGLLVVGAWLASRIPHWIQREPTLVPAAGQPEGAWKGFRHGWRSIRELRLLQLLAIGTTLMTVLLALFNFQVDHIFSQNYQDADDLAGLFGLLRSLADGIALPFQLFLLTRIVNRVGVGWANLFYPALAVGSYGLLAVFPRFPLAVLGLFVQKGFRSGVRNPLDNMLYNGVPRAVKGRARAFVNGILVPVATLLAGLLMFLVPPGGALPWPLLALGGVVGLGYLGVTWYVRRAYSQALVETLKAEDSQLYQLAGAEWDATDRAALDHVLARLRESQDEGATVFLAQLAYEVGDRDALPALAELASEGSPVVRAGILELVGSAGLSHPQMRQLCTAGLTDADRTVRRVALTVLETEWQSGAGAEDGGESLLALALDRLYDPDPGVRVRAISLLLRSGDLYYLTVAASTLNQLLAAADPALRALALSTLGEMGDSRFVRTLTPHLADPHEGVRRAAAQAIAAVVSPTALLWVRELALEAAEQALADRAEAVRLAAVQILGRLASSQARPALLATLQDDRVRVRESARQVLEGMGPEVVDELEALLEAESGRARDSAIVALLHLSTERYRGRADAEIHGTMERAYCNMMLMDALSPLPFSGAALAVHTLRDRNQALLEHVFRILAALHGAETVGVIWHNLQSVVPHARANAVEALEAITSPLVARLVTPLGAGAADADGASSSDVDIVALAQEACGLGAEPWSRITDPAAAVELLLTGQDPWLRAVGLYLLGEAGSPGPAWTDRVSGVMPALIAPARCEQVIRTASGSADGLVVEAAQYAARRLGLSSAEEEVPAMLSTIEKVIFLKEVPIFDEMTVAQLRVLAGIAEEVAFDDDGIIFHEGEPGDTLYVVVSGRVGIEHQAEGGSESVARLATLEPRQYFGEMSIFDQAPRSATAIAIGPTLLLSIRREPLIALVEGDPTLALELIRVLSQRLRDVNEELARKTKAAPRKLQKLYDQLV